MVIRRSRPFTSQLATTDSSFLSFISLSFLFFLSFFLSFFLLSSLLFSLLSSLFLFLALNDIMGNMWIICGRVYRLDRSADFLSENAGIFAGMKKKVYLCSRFGGDVALVVHKETTEIKRKRRETVLRPL